MCHQTCSFRALAAAALLLLSNAVPASESKQERQAEARAEARTTLEQLYRLQPAARDAVARAAGHAVFSNFGMKIFVAGGGTGHGIAVSNRTKKETFMKMVEVQGGLGFGIKRYRLVWLFETPKAFDAFVNSGWEFGAQTTMAAQVGSTGVWAAGAMSVSPGVWLYQLTEDGLALELTATGTKYYRDDELN